jgi:hypothetical protein
MIRPDKGSKSHPVANLYSVIDTDCRAGVACAPHLQGESAIVIAGARTGRRRQEMLAPAITPAAW